MNKVGNKPVYGLFFINILFYTFNHYWKIQKIVALSVWTRIKQPKTKRCYSTALYRVYRIENNSPFYKFNIDNELTIWIVNFNNLTQSIKFTIKKHIKNGKINSYIFSSNKNKDFIKSLAIELYQCLNKRASMKKWITN